jgi:quinol monooxygenase YgiN
MIVGIVGSIQVRAEKTAEFERVFLGLTAKVRGNESGNLIYQLVRIRGKRGSYKMIEFYTDQQAYDQHRKAAYLQEDLGQLMACLVGAPQVEVIEGVG